MYQLREKVCSSTLSLLLFVLPYPHAKYVGNNTVNLDLSYKTREEKFLQQICREGPERNSAEQNLGKSSFTEVILPLTVISE